MSTNAGPGHDSLRGVDDDKRPARVARERPATEVDTVAGVDLTHPGRVLFPEQGITKLELARYYDALADRLLPHVAGRPLTVVRCPRGRQRNCFFQKHAMKGMPDSVRLVSIASSSGARDDHLMIDDRAGLASLVQHGVLELHPWGCRADRPERPDRIVVDLDPGPRVAWKRVIAAAVELRHLLDDLGLVSFARTTGGKGLHVVVPIERRADWEQVKEFTRDLARALDARLPGELVLTASKARREGRIFVDVLRNTRGATAVASYSARARAGAPVALPVAWKDVTPALDPKKFTVVTVPDLVQRKSDPWAEFPQVRQVLTKAMRAGVRDARTPGVNR